MPATKDLISAIYLMYCCDGEERQQLMDICKENERKTMEYLNQNYDISELFKKTKEVVKEKSFVKKLISKTVLFLPVVSSS